MLRIVQGWSFTRLRMFVYSSYVVPSNYLLHCLCNAYCSVSFSLCFIQIVRHARGVGRSIDVCDKVWQGVGGFFCSVMSHFLNNSIFSTFCFIIENLAIFQKKFGFTSKNNLAYLLWCYFEAKNYISLKKSEKYPIEIHNMTSHNGGGWVVLNLWQSVTGGGWASKYAKISVT